MNERDTERSVGNQDAVEVLLLQAAPRPAPPAADAQLVRETVRAEWRAVTGRFRRRQQFRNLAIAASLLVAVALAFNGLQLGQVAPTRVASIDKSQGPIYLLGERAELTELSGSAVVSTGQTIVTGADGRIGLAWGTGGSLRVDEQTRIEFRSTDTVYLQSGRLYFDSTASGHAAGISSGSGQGAATLVIETPHGAVTHLGTQYMTFADDRRLSVSVREGQVQVDSRYYTDTASAGQQLTLTGSSRPSLVNFNGYGTAWDWIETVSPGAELDGRTVYEFLTWVGRETGLAVEFDSAEAEALARSETLRGTVDTEPRNALRIWMLAVDLDWRMEEGVIQISAMDSDSGG